MRRITVIILAFLLLGPSARPSARQFAAAPVLAPTNHPRVPTELSDFWMVPDSNARSAAQGELAAAITLEADSKHEAALGILSRLITQEGPLSGYAAYYKGVAELNLGRPADALRTFQRLSDQAPVGYLTEAAALREAESDEALGNQAAAADFYERLSITKTIAPDDVLMRLGRAAKVAGQTGRAVAAFSRVYFEYPTGDLAPLANAELDTLPDRPALTPGSARYRSELERAERLYAAKSYAQARSAFENVRRIASGDDRDLASLRMAECDYRLRRLRASRDALKPFVDKGLHRSEALYFYASVLRDLRLGDAFVKNIQRLIDEFPNESWSEEALNSLASYDIVEDDDQAADRTLRQLYARAPSGRFAERAAWKIGWLAYKNGLYADTVRFFEEGASQFPRSDYRPAWLYWSGRAHDELKEPDLGQARYAVLAADYANTYYGRLGAPRLTATQRQLMVSLRSQAEPPAPIPPPPNQDVVRALLASELYDQALKEVRYAQVVWGDSPSIQATMGFIYHQQGDFRAGINAIKRGYPQYMTAGGEKLPMPLLKLLYPVDYWPLIQRYSTERGLDPYMIAALILQESNFDPGIRSPANAYGLMQLLPSTGRRYARTLRLTNRFSVSLLKKADANLNMGTAYFADLLKETGAAHYALASYNAGVSRVNQWIAGNPDVPRDEFIEDIPFPETQNYVKRVLGTMEDFRRLYGSRAADDDGDRDADAAPASGHSTERAAARKAAGRATPAKKSAGAPAKQPLPAKKTSASKKSH